MSSRMDLAKPIAWLGLSVALTAGAGSVAADEIDPNTPSVITVGAPTGAASQARLDDRRTGLSKTALPTAPAELWRRSLGTIEVSPLVDANGAITIALASAEVVRLSPQGKEIWRTRMQGGGPAAAPIRLSDGTFGVVSTGGFFVGVSDRGKVRFSTPLGARGPDLVAAPVATDDGGAAIVAGRSLVTIDADGRIETETMLPGHVSSPPIVTAEGLLVVSDDGTVTRVRPPKQPQKVGSFGGLVDGGAVLSDERTLLGVMRDRLVALDLRTGVASVRASTGSFAVIDGPVTVRPDKSVIFTTTDGLLFELDRSGQESARATVERVVAPPPGQPGGAPGYPPGYGPGGYMGSFGGGGYYNGQAQRTNPPVVVDEAGRVAFLRAVGRFGIWAGDTPADHRRPRAEKTDASSADAADANHDGSGRSAVSVVAEHICNTPLAVLPAGKDRVAVVCREGLVALYGD